MLSERARLAVADIIKHAEFAIEFSGGRNRVDIVKDDKTYFAIVRCLEIVSEASRRLPDSFKQDHPTIPWRQVADAGNVYRHNYDGLAPEDVIATVEDDLPSLIFAMQQALGKPR